MTGRGKRVVAGTGLSVGAALGIAGPAHAIEVNDDGDPGVDGICDAAECTLREAIADANAAADADVITFAAGLTGSTITLDPGVGYGRLLIEEPLDIQGLGAGALTVSGGDATALFDVDMTTPGDDVTISGLALADGFVDDENGGAIRSDETDLFVDQAVLSGNTAGDTGVMTTGEDDRGGAIYSSDGSLTVTDSTITGNSASEDGAAGGGIAALHVDSVDLDGLTISANHSDGFSGDGGGVYAYDAVAVSITRSAITGNTANGDSGDGAGLYAYGGLTPSSLDISTSTISGNEAPGFDGIGAGLYAAYEEVSVANSTFSGNMAGYFGGGIAMGFGGLTLVGSTVAGNAAYGGGGIAKAVEPATLQNTIVADNTATAAGPDVSGDFDAAFSLVENPAATPGAITTTIANSNIFGQDPQLDALADNDSQDAGAPGMVVPIETQLPAATSLAVDCGRSFGATTDQRALTRPVELSPPNSTAAGADGADIGAVELQMLGGPGRTIACPTPPTPPAPSTPTVAPAPGFNLSAAIKRCKKRFHGKKRKKCIKKQRKKAQATIAQPGWPEPRSQRDR